MGRGVRVVHGEEALVAPVRRPGEASAAGSLRRVLGRDWLAAWLFLVPCLLVLVGLIGYPFVSAILLSFQAKLVGTPGVWVGLQNYQDLLFARDLSDPFLQSLRVKVFFTLVAVVIKFCLGMAIALLFLGQIT